jgi:phosphatidylglycerophosphate synthase
VAIAEAMNDPPNRFYRYPVARWLLPLVLKTPLTPNGVTYIHMALGVLAGPFVAQGTRSGFFIAILLSEIRMILDCVDGVLARAKGISSNYGRALDELADGAAYLSLVIGMCVVAHRQYPTVPVHVLGFFVFAGGFFMAGGTDFFRRRFGSALKFGKDIVYEDYYAKHNKLKAGWPGLVYWCGYAVDYLQVNMLMPGSRHEFFARLAQNVPPGEPGPEVHYIVRNANSRQLRFALRCVAMMSGDNMFPIFYIGLLLGNPLAALVIGLAYSCLMMLVTLLSCWTFLGNARRPLEQQR